MLFAGNNVILKTPTGSGKSLVALALQFKSLCQGRRSYYTVPIKALANEKFSRSHVPTSPLSSGKITNPDTWQDFYSDKFFNPSRSTRELMKTLSFTIISLGIAAATSQAIEAPVDDSPPPAEAAKAANALPGEKAEPAQAPENQQAPYLGVVAGAIPEMLAVHIGLHGSEGVVVRALMPDGPAAAAGLAVHDVITRIGGQPVASSEVLSREINQLKAGDKVSLDLIQKGKKVVMDVTLGARPAQLVAPQIKPLDQLNQLNLDGVPQELAERVRRMIDGNIGEQALDFGDGIHDAAPQFQEAMREMKQRVEEAMGGFELPDLNDQGGIQIQQGATFRMMDDQGSIEMKSIHDGKEITVRDKNQQAVWSGPWDTDQDKAAAPEDVRKRVEKLNFDNNGNGLQMRFKGLNPEE